MQTDAYPSRAAIAGHPIHPILVTIPIGSLVLALLTDIASWRTGDRFWARASRLLLGTGAAGAALAAPSGSIDLLTIPRARQLPQAWLHAGGNLLVLGLSTANLLTRDGERRVDSGHLAMTALGATLLAGTGWLGGELVFRHRIGVTESRNKRRGRRRVVALPVGDEVDASVDRTEAPTGG